MKLKNVKKRTRVVLKEDFDHLTKGMIGTILEDDDTVPFVSWDNWSSDYKGWRNTGYDNSCYAMDIEYLKRIKESV